MRNSFFSKLKLTGGIIFILERLYGIHEMTTKLKHLRSLETGTVGKEIANMLDTYGYRLIPKFENHDLKHIVLDFPMTMRDEIRMQAYLVGNGNKTLPCLIFLSLAVFYPNIWLELPGYYRIGKSCKSIYYLRMEDCMHEPLDAIRKQFGRSIH